MITPYLITIFSLGTNFIMLIGIYVKIIERLKALEVKMSILMEKHKL